jgi:hypothetical protein
MTLFIITSLLVGLAVIGLGISIFFTKKRQFPESHVGRNKAMQERGIDCVLTADRKERAKLTGNPDVPVVNVAGKPLNAPAKKNSPHAADRGGSV